MTFVCRDPAETRAMFTVTELGWALEASPSGSNSIPGVLRLRHLRPDLTLSEAAVLLEDLWLRGRTGGLTHDEIVTHYRESGVEYWRKTPVTRRTDVDNRDVTSGRRSTCICGYCGDSFVCACGRDRVGHGQRCVTCGRPWWCER